MHCESRTVTGLFFIEKTEGIKMSFKLYDLAIEAIMREKPYSNYDSGCDGICEECRSCRFHRPYWKYQSCVFRECPYSTIVLSTARMGEYRKKER